MAPAVRLDAAAAIAKAMDRFPSGRDVLALQLRFFPLKTSVETLMGCLTDRDRNVQSSAWEALMAITGMDFPADARQWRSWWEQMGSAQPRWKEAELGPAGEAGSRTEDGGGKTATTQPSSVFDPPSSNLPGAPVPPVYLPMPEPPFVPEPERTP
jgi:hypothetical protein